MIDTLIHLEGNPRACVYTEALWGIPYNLYLPYVSVYMLAFGLHDSEIGLISSIGLFVQIFVSFISGIVTDKLGRRLTTFIFDMVSWSVPVLLWAIGGSFWVFLAAALFNAVFRMTANSWTCLLVEDAPPAQLVTIWSWVTIAGLLSGFFSPAAGILVERFSLVTAVRILYLNAFVLMTAKFIILFIFSHETRQGTIRRAATAGIPVTRLFGNWDTSLREIVRSPYTIYAFLTYLVMLIYETVKNLFWSVFVVRQLGFPDASIAVFPFFRSALMLAFYFLVTPRLDHRSFRRPFIAGFAMLILSNVALFVAPRGSWLFVILSTVLDGAAFALITPFKETLLNDAVPADNRAGIIAILNVAMLTIASPFSWIAGIMSERARVLPFVLLSVLALLGIVFMTRIARYRKRFGEGS